MCGSSPPTVGAGEVRTILPGVHIVETSFANVPLFLPLFAGDSASLIDAGVAGVPRSSVLPALSRLGVDERRLHLVALTHAHHDHFGGLAELKEAAPGLRVAVHRHDVRWVEQHDAYYGELFLRFPREYAPSDDERAVIFDQSGKPTAVSNVLEYGDRLVVKDDHQLRALPAGSHTRGSIAYFDEGSRFLATGDALQSNGTPLLDGTEAFPIYEDLQLYLDMVRAFRSLDVEWLCDAHRGLFGPEEAAKLLDACAAWPDTYTEQLRQFLHGSPGPASLRAIADGVQLRWYPSANRGIQLYLTTNVHLQELVRCGEAHSLMVAGRKHWV